MGPANLRSDDPTPERDLSPAATMIMRLMLHMSMYLASSTHAQVSLCVSLYVCLSLSYNLTLLVQNNRVKKFHFNVISLKRYLKLCLDFFLQDVCSLISPTIPEDMLEKYLHHHIRTDLRDIGKAVGRNEDDVILLIHLLLQHMTSAKATSNLSYANKMFHYRLYCCPQDLTSLGFLL